jgi:hypothetical protein
MKNFFLVLFILLILAAAAFFFGWAQLSVPPGSYGILQSKTHGLDPNPVRDGEFRWIWYKLIPTNVTITVYSLQNVERDIALNGRLPSGEVYGAFAGLDTDFSYNYSVRVSLSLKEDSLLELVREKRISGQEDLRSYEVSLADSIAAFISGKLTSGDYDTDIENILNSGSSARLEEEIRSRFPYVDTLNLYFHSVRFPDMALYHSLQSIYGEFLRKQQEIGAERRINTRVRLDELAQYGELLTKYPILLQYLTIEQGDTVEK